MKRILIKKILIIGLTIFIISCYFLKQSSKENDSRPLSSYSPTKYLNVSKDILIVIGETLPLRIEYSGFVDPQISYKSESDDIVSVDKNGIITANKIGATKIYVSIKSTDEKDTLVKPIFVYVESIAYSLEIKPEKLFIKVGQQERISINITPKEAADNVEPKYWISDENIISYNPELRLVKALKKGSTILNIIYLNGTSDGLVAECTVTVE